MFLKYHEACETETKSPPSLKFERRNDLLRNVVTDAHPRLGFQCTCLRLPFAQSCRSKVPAELRHLQVSRLMCNVIGRCITAANYVTACNVAFC